MALGLAACRLGKRVRSFTAASLVTRLEDAQKQYQLDRVLAQLDRTDLLICDELGYLSFSRAGAELAVIDTSAAKVVKYLPLAEDNALIAAGQDKLFVALPGANAVQRWDLGTFEKETTAPLIPKGGAIRHLLLGSAAHGPLLVIGGRDLGASYFWTRRP